METKKRGEKQIKLGLFGRKCHLGYIERRYVMDTEKAQYRS